MKSRVFKEIRPELIFRPENYCTPNFIEIATAVSEISEKIVPTYTKNICHLIRNSGIQHSLRGNSQILVCGLERFMKKLVHTYSR